MHIWHWLQSLKSITRDALPRRLRHNTSRLTERLESRALPAVSVLLVGGSELNISADLDDSIIVRSIGGAVAVETTIPGQPFAQDNTLSGVPSSSLQSLIISGGSLENLIDLSNVFAAGFPNLTLIQVNGRNGDDTIFGSPDFASLLVGEDGADTMTGGNLGDTISGLDGADSIDSGDGNDSVLGGDGSDVISTGAGNDTVESGSGQDTVSMGDGDDSALAGNGDDSILGEAGNDTLNGDGGTDTIEGSDGNDSILGGDSNDSLLGDAGDDTLNGQAGQDTIDGGDGSDSIRGGTGHDAVNGGFGDDFVNAENGNDTVLGGDGDDTLQGGGGNDSILGDTGDDIIRGQGGRDFVDGGGGSDLLDGGDDGDLVRSFDTTSRVVVPQITIDDASVGEGSATLLFNTAVGYPALTGGGAVNAFEAITANDFDDDGDIDAALTVTSGTVQLMINNGVGGFTPGPRLAVGSSPRGITSADFDGDGDFDIAASNSVGANVSLLVNLGGGNFAPAATLNLPNFSFPLGIIAADVTGDGRPELITANVVTNNVSVLVNNGLGTFGVRRDFATGQGPNEVVAGDFDGDGDLDLATADANTNTVTVLTNNGGTFATRASFAAGNRPVTIASLDLENDGDLDIAAGCTGNNEITVLANSGSGSFTTVAQLTTSGSIGNFNLIALDIDGDTNTDLVVGNRNVFNEVNAFVNAGGTFLGRQDFNFPNPGDTGGPLVAGDVNGDGSRDVLVAGLVDDQLHILINPNPPISTRFAMLTVTLSLPSTQTVTVDFNAVDGSAISGTDFDPATGTLIFAPGQTSQTISVRSRRDALVEPTENFFVNLGNPVNATIGDGQGHVSLFDGNGGIPGPTLRISDALLVPEGTSGIANVDLTVTLTAPSLQSVTVDFATGDGTAAASSDYIASSGSLAFAPGETSQTVTVRVFRDSRSEGDETFVVNLIDPVGIVLSDSRGEILIIDDDPASSGTATLLGGAGDDTLLGSDFDENFNGGGGSDLINASGGNDSVLGGSGADTLNGNAGNDTLNGQGGNDSLNGGSEDDSLLYQGASSGNDTAAAGGGRDTVIVQGDNTNNNFVVSAALGSLKVSDGLFGVTVDPDVRFVLVRGGNGNDTISVAGSLVGVPASGLTILGDAGADVLTAQGATLGDIRMFLSGDSDNDTIIGSNSNDTIVGGDGDDSLSGFNGNDTILGGAGRDIIGGLLGDDSLNGGDGDDSINGNEGNDLIVGELGNDTLKGDEGHDTLSAGDGDDNLNGMGGNDSLTGSLGRDQLSGGGGDDTLDGGRNDDTLNGNSGNDKIRGEHGNDLINASDGNDTINGGDGNDTILAGLGDDAISGHDGDDSINGDGGNDTIVGGDGADVLLGGANQDVLLGEDGADTINGQGGTDINAGGQGVDVISEPVAEINEQFVLSLALRQALQAL